MIARLCESGALAKLHVVILPVVAGTSAGAVLPLLTQSVRLRLEHFESLGGEVLATYAVMARRKLASLRKTQRLFRAA